MSQPETLLRSRFKRLLRFIVLTYNHFESDRCFILASSIVYTTLISLVPFLTFIVSILTAFQAFNNVLFNVQELLIEQFGTVAGTELANMLNGFIRNAGGLGTVGLISFLVTSVILINRVWITINQIYRVPMHRNRIARFVRFVTIMIIGTLLLAAYFSINSFLSRWFMNLVGFTIFSQWFYLIITVIGPWLLIWLVLFLLIFFVPSTRVKFRSALLGSVCGMVGFQVANLLFSKVVINFINYSSIYGSLASILVMLFWIFFLWVIIFASVEIAYVHQYLPDIEKKRGIGEPPALKTANGLNVLLLIAGRFENGSGPVNARDIARILRIPDRTLFSFLELFVTAGLILPIDRLGRSYIAAKPLAPVPVAEVLDLLFDGAVGEDSVKRESIGEKTVHDLFVRGKLGIDGLTVADLLEQNKG